MGIKGQGWRFHSFKLPEEARPLTKHGEVCVLGVDGVRFGGLGQGGGGSQPTSSKVSQESAGGPQLAARLLRRLCGQQGCQAGGHDYSSFRAAPAEEWGGWGGCLVSCQRRRRAPCLTTR